jgi:hypothetical protein
MGRKRIQKEEFFNKVRNQNLDFNQTNFIDMKTPIEVICLIHGLFKIRPGNMLYKHEGCKFCGMEKMAKSKSLTKQEFIKRAEKIHNGKYDYSLVDYKNNKIKVKIICKKCGKIFEQLPENHLNGCGCPNCKLLYPLQ